RWSVWGALSLMGALVAARKGDSAIVTDYLNEAARAAREVGNDSNDLRTSFGPTNVAFIEFRLPSSLAIQERQSSAPTKLMCPTYRIIFGNGDPHCSLTSLGRTGNGVIKEQPCCTC